MGSVTYYEIKDNTMLRENSTKQTHVEKYINTKRIEMTK